MLLSLSPLNCASLQGISLLLHRQWTTSAAFQSEEVLGSFSEALFRLRGDAESTKPYAAQLGSPILSDLESAMQISLRRLPERFKKGCSLYAAIIDTSAEDARIHYKLPSWIRLSIMTRGLGAYVASNSEEKWRTLDAQKESFTQEPWAEAILNFFQSPTAKTLLQTQQTLPPGVTHYRVAELIQRSALPGLAPSYSLNFGRGVST